MYSTYLPSNAATLPRSTMSSLSKFRESQPISFCNINGIDESEQEHQLSKHSDYNKPVKDNNDIFIENRPTYGAYTNNTLPRGPYLQYKFNDIVSLQDDNNKKYRQIEKLKKEFTGLPRLRIRMTDNGVKTKSIVIEDNNYCRNNPKEVSDLQSTTDFNQTASNENSEVTFNTYQTINNSLNANAASKICPPPKPLRSYDSKHIQFQNYSELKKYNTISNGQGTRKLIHSNENFSGNRNGIVGNFDYEKELLQHNSNQKYTSEEARCLKYNKCQIILSACSNVLCAKSINLKNYVTLAEVVDIKVNGLDQDEGWAVLCQSVQALQDLFLADTPSTSRILPLVTPSTLQITSRGRVALKITPTAEITEKFWKEDCKCFDSGTMSYLSPEYILSSNRNVNFSESDIERMWIFSLGSTLHNTITSCTAEEYTTKFGNTSLDNVIRSMCEKDLKKRASLMYLLDVISAYCRSHHQNKPFSHIVMDLFKEVVNLSETLSNKQYQTDCISTGGNINSNNINQDIGTKKRYENQSQNYHPPIIGGEIPKFPDNFNHDLNKPPEKKLYVRKKDEILKKRNRDFRRNTIDVNLADLKRAEEALNCKINGSNSTNFSNALCFKKTTDRLNENGASMPDLDRLKAATLPYPAILRRGNFSVQYQTYCQQLMKSNGPEFIVNSNKPIKEICLTEIDKDPVRRTVNILHLNGQQINIICNPLTTTAYHIFEALIKSEKIVENFFLGLCVLIKGDFIFIPFDLKIYKVAPQLWASLSSPIGKLNVSDNIIFNLFVRVKYFLPTLRGVSSLDSRHLLYLQLRKSILERQIVCTEDDLICLGGLALQAETGDFVENMKNREYFTVSHYLPEHVYQKNKEMARHLRNSHLSKTGLHPLEARHNFIRYVQELKEYGLHLFSAIWANDNSDNRDVFVGISLGGISIFHRCSENNTYLTDPDQHYETIFNRQRFMGFDWLEIENLCFSKQILCVVVRKSMSLSNKDKCRMKYKFKMADRKSYFAFSLASEHHKFYMKLRNSFTSIKYLSDELNIPIDAEDSADTTNNNNANLISAPQQCPDMDNNLKDSETKSRSEPLLNTEKLQRKSKTMKIIKKSMLNDNKLMKLKQKFLKRSKSSAEIKPIISNAITKVTTKEENQNKENECPRVIVLDQKLPKSQTLNRNKVKMGTRVFSTQFLNKSMDNIYGGNVPMEFYSIDIAEGEDNYSVGGNAINNCGNSDGISMKSTSVGSIYFANKMSQNSDDNPDAPCVVHSSIRSINKYQHPLIENETVSESLLEKFNNISCNNGTNDRIIRNIVILKDRVNLTDKLSTQSSIRNTNSILNRLTRFTSMKAPSSNKQQESYSLGLSIVQGTDNNVYVKDIVKNGPGEKHGINIGDQIIAVNGVSLLNLPYSDALKILKNTGPTVELSVSQIYQPQVHPDSSVSIYNPVQMTATKYRDRNLVNYKSESINLSSPNRSINKELELSKNNVDYLRQIRFQTEDIYNQVNNEEKLLSIYDNSNSSVKGPKRANIDDVINPAVMSSKSMPNIQKEIATHIIKKQHNNKTAYPRSIGHSRRFIGHTQYPVTPGKSSNSSNLNNFECANNNNSKLLAFADRPAYASSHGLIKYVYI